ncbi:hypothetical protein SDC9_42568 [bioreactor metagenome]|uniref:Citrate transporter-like domain-containing protein n=1 Tax=bioreactor metagenome TaxID=1076179 RepID=A0A644VZ13_9ZZZZ
MSPAAISLIGILVGITFLIIVSYKGVPVMFVAPISAIIVLIFSQQNVIEGMTSTYMTGFAGFAKNYLLIFFMGSVFGRIMGDSGAAKSIAYKITRLAKRLPGNTDFWAVAGLVLISSVLTYGGISVFVIMFTMVTIGRELFQERDIPWKMYGCVCLGSGAYTLTMLPGTPQITNIIPTKYFGTTTMAAPMLGIIAAITCAALGFGYIYYEVVRLKKRGEGFFPTGEEIAKTYLSKEDENFKELPLILCIIPSIALLIALNVFNLNAAFALLVGILVAVALYYKRLEHIWKTCQEGGTTALVSTCIACFVIAFGSVVSASPGFQLVVSSLDKIPGPPIVQLMIAVNICCGITGSSSGGLTITLNALSERFLATGVNPQVLHRMAAVCSGGLDSLPHNGTVVNSMAAYKINHHMSYKYYFMLNTVIPIISSIVMLFFAQMGVV